LKQQNKLEIKQGTVEGKLESIHDPDLPFDLFLTNLTFSSGWVRLDINELIFKEK
jgi:hypothetical protein